MPPGSNWVDYASANELMFSAMAAYSQTKDPAYAFRAWLAWRMAAGLQIDALGERRQAYPPGLADAVVASATTQFLERQEALFRMLDEVAGQGALEASKAARTQLARYNVGVLMGDEMQRGKIAGADQRTMLKAVARTMGLTPSNARKLFDGFLEKSPDNIGMGGLVREIFDSLRATKLQRGKAPRPVAKTKRLKGRLKPKSWAGPLKR
jgi:hypothetical protein